MTVFLEVQCYTQIISFSGSESENVLTRRSPGATAGLGRVSDLRCWKGSKQMDCRSCLLWDLVNKGY